MLDRHPHTGLMVRRLVLCVAFVFALLAGSAGWAIVDGPSAMAHPVGDVLIADAGAVEAHVVRVDASAGDRCPPGGCEADPAADKECVGPSVSCSVAAAMSAAIGLGVADHSSTDVGSSADFGLSGVFGPVEIPPPR